LSQLNPNETQCADFEARFCCPAFNKATESSYTDVYDTTMALFTDGQSEPTASTGEYFKSFDKTTETYESKRWSFEDFDLTEPARLDELRNFIKY